MNTTPTVEQVAHAAAVYAVSEFPSLSSWFTYEDELAAKWLEDPMFRCTAEYAIKRTMDVMRYNAQMQAMAAQRGGGAKGVAYVIGHVLGEWTAGNTTIDRELASW